MSAQVQCQAIESDIEKWTDFNQKLQSQTTGKIPSPFAPVETLVLKYLKQPCSVLDIGCETGKIPLVL